MASLLSSKSGREIFIIALMALALFLVAGRFDILEALVAFCHKYEEYELDELITTSIFLSFALFVFALRRWHETQVVNDLLEAKNHDLKAAVKEIHQLQGIIPICSSCKKIRDDKGYWQRVEEYVESNSEARFSHSLCPDCLDTQLNNIPPHNERE
ncbi:MAG: hypothetical protein MI892_08510 [Desulfobacterales bacterium]|nr:hypothetical protein [Desulfobacterales bacterium]